MERIRHRARVFGLLSLATLLITFAALYWLQRPTDDVALVSQWSPFEVEVWFRQIGHAMPSELRDHDHDGLRLAMLSLTDLRRLYKMDGKEDTAVAVYHELQHRLRPLAPVTLWFILTLIVQTMFIYGCLFTVMLCCGVRWVKKKVDESPMMKQMKMLTGSFSPSNGQAGAAGSAVMDPMMMNPLMNPFGMMGMGGMGMGMGMGMPSPAGTVNGHGNSSTDSDDPTDVVDAPVNAGSVIDPSAMMMANPFLFPFGPPLPGMMPPGGSAGAAAGMPPGLFLPPFGMMGMPPIGAAGRPIRRRPGTAPAKQADWQPEVD